MSPPESAILAAVAAGSLSPCAKSKRGAVVYCPGSGVVLGRGWNGQPSPFSCTGSDECHALCGRLCIHAEVRAIRDATAGFGNLGFPAGDVELVHAKVVDGQLAAGGGPSCWQCSREILDVGIAAVWLFEQVLPDREPHLGRVAGGWERPGETWRRYTAEEFHRATAAHHNLPLKVRL